MLTPRTCRLALLTALGAVMAAASTAPLASAATQRYASPTGSGTDCSFPNPCTIRQAVEHASDGGEVIVRPGDYPLTTTLADPARITIRGAAGQPRPRLMFSGAGQKGLRLAYQSTLRFVEVDQAAQGNMQSALYVSGTGLVDQVIAKAPGLAARIVNSTIRNSIAVATGTGGRALLTDRGLALDSTGTYRNVTAIATGSGGVAIEANAVNGGSATIHLVNVIAYGGPGALSLRASTDSYGALATITATHTDYQSADTVGSGSAFVDGGGNRAEEPAFVNAAGGDYRQAADAYTIDAGLGDSINGAFDVDGDPRAIGTSDIGADEFVPAPTATTGPAGAVTGQTATVSGSVNAKGAPTSYHFQYGATTAYSATTAPTAAGSGTGAAAAGATLGGLSAGTTYHYRLVATNAGGVTKGADRTFTTASPPPTQTQIPPPTKTSPPPNPRPFAGVRLVSTRLSFGGRFITLRLSCPVATVGRCSGLTKLTGRRRASSRRVTLGRARFSIAAGTRAKVKVHVSRAGRRLLSGRRHPRARDTNATHDGAGQSKTTKTAVTIRRRHR